MTQYTREQVMNETRLLAKMLANTAETDRFKQGEAKNKSIENDQKLISKIKLLQRQVVNLQAYDKAEALKKVEAGIDQLQEELDSIPVVEECKEIQGVVNDVLQMVSGTIAREVTNHVIRDTEGDLLAGETGSKVANKIPGSSCK